MPRTQMIYVRVSEPERDLLKALATRLQMSESAALRFVMAAAANELVLAPQDDLRGIFRKVLSGSLPDQETTTKE